MPPSHLPPTPHHLVPWCTSKAICVTNAGRVVSYSPRLTAKLACIPDETDVSEGDRMSQGKSILLFGFEDNDPNIKAFYKLDMDQGGTRYGYQRTVMNLIAKRIRALYAYAGLTVSAIHFYSCDIASPNALTTGQDRTHFHRVALTTIIDALKQLYCNDTGVFWLGGAMDGVTNPWNEERADNAAVCLVDCAGVLPAHLRTGRVSSRPLLLQAARPYAPVFLSSATLPRTSVATLRGMQGSPMCELLAFQVDTTQERALAWMAQWREGRVPAVAASTPPPFVGGAGQRVEDEQFADGAAVQEEKAARAPAHAPRDYRKERHRVRQASKRERSARSCTSSATAVAAAVAADEARAARVRVVKIMSSAREIAKIACIDTGFASTIRIAAEFVADADIALRMKTGLPRNVTTKFRALLEQYEAMFPRAPVDEDAPPPEWSAETDEEPEPWTPMLDSIHAERINMLMPSFLAPYAELLEAMGDAGLGVEGAAVH